MTFTCWTIARNELDSLPPTSLLPLPDDDPLAACNELDPSLPLSSMLSLPDEEKTSLPDDDSLAADNNDPLPLSSMLLLRDDDDGPLSMLTLPDVDLLISTSYRTIFN